MDEASALSTVEQPTVMTLNFADDHPMAPKVRQLQKVRAGIEALRASGASVSAALTEWEHDLTEEIVAEAFRRGFAGTGFVVC